MFYPASHLFFYSLTYLYLARSQHIPGHTLPRGAHVSASNVIVHTQEAVSSGPILGYQCRESAPDSQLQTSLPECLTDRRIRRASSYHITICLLIGFPTTAFLFNCLPRLTLVVRLLWNVTFIWIYPSKGPSLRLSMLAVALI